MLNLRKYFPCLLLLIGTICSCEKLEFSPNQAFSETSSKNLNLKNINKLSSLKNDDTLRIAFIGDSQRFYDECEAFVKMANSARGIDLVILAGDITQYGLSKEYEWITRTFDKLSMPYIMIIGNHDMVGNGTEIYKNTFGPLDFSFIYDGVKFVAHNTNCRENAFDGTVPNIPWLRQEMSTDASVRHIIPISHVPPYDADFDPALVKPYTETFNQAEKVSLSLHGHVHYVNDGFPYGNKVRYFNGYSMGGRQYFQVDITGDSISTSLLPF